MADKQVDILIVGGGLTGATLMLALAASGYTTLLVEAKPFADRVQPNFDARTLALAPASVRILQMLKLWPLLEEHATAIATIHISEQRHFGRALLHGDEKEPLGYVVEMQHIHQALHQLLCQQQIIAPAMLKSFNPANNIATISTNADEITIQAKLVVAADGADSSVRKWCNLATEIKAYPQHALIANIGLARSHQHHAYERFTSSGPLALLPMTDRRSSLVWSLPPADATRLKEMNEREFLGCLQRAFGYRLGRFVKAGQRVVYPIRQVIMPQQVMGTVVFVGNAAHTLHPVAGQGFNLGLRDVALLAQCIIQKGLSPEMLQDYQQQRRYDQKAITYFTDGLVELFTNQIPGMGCARGAGLIALDNLTMIKRILARHARGFAGISPDLACGIPLPGESFFRNTK